VKLALILFEGFDLMTAPGSTLGGDTVGRVFSTAMSAREKSGMIELEERDVSAAEISITKVIGGIDHGEAKTKGNAPPRGGA
jgi:hypothetical protein